MRKQTINTIDEFPLSPYVYLIYYKPKCFIVNLDSNYDLEWETSFDFDNTTEYKKYTSEIQEVMNIVASLDCKITFEWPIAIQKNAKRMIGEGIVRAFYFDFTNAHNALEKADSFIIQKSQEIARLWTLQSSILTAFSFISLSILCIFFKQAIVTAIGFNTYLLFLSSGAGACGALLSIIARIGNYSFGYGFGKWLHYYEGGSRILLGGICGIFACLLLKSGIIKINILNLDTISILTFSFIAGISEKMLHNIILKTIKKEGEKS